MSRTTSKHGFMRTVFIATEKYRTNCGRTSALVMNGSYL